MVAEICCGRPDTVLVVCTGNTCRSPVAERLLADRLSFQGIEVRSAGVAAAPGAPATAQAVRAAQEAGYQLDDHRSRSLEQVDWDRVFLVATMTRQHATAVRRHLQKHRRFAPPVALLGQLADGEDAEVPDPIGQSLDVYEEMVAQLQDMADGVTQEILRMHNRVKEGDEFVADCSRSTVFDKVALGCDHAGYSLKDEVTGVLQQMAVQWEDFGTDSTDSVDYPQFAGRVARAVADGSCDAGILLCGTGIGMSIAANKVRGIRAAVCADEFSARAARQHNNANILALGSRTTGPGLAAEMVRIFLRTSFDGGRHARRLDSITDLQG